jgi:hypothetical protein
LEKGSKETTRSFVSTIVARAAVLSPSLVASVSVSVAVACLLGSTKKQELK